jgi:hypothetical protein
MEKVFEGTWEEVALLASELAGHRVRVTLLDDDSQRASAGAPEEKEHTAFDLMSKAGLIGCIKGGPTDLATNPAHMEGFGGE